LRIILEVRQDGSGRFEGSVLTPDSRVAQPFEGILELVGLIEASLATPAPAPALASPAPGAGRADPAAGLASPAAGLAPPAGGADVLGVTAENSRD
jgi:hypothetical protein